MANTVARKTWVPCICGVNKSSRIFGSPSSVRLILSASSTRNGNVSRPNSSICATTRLSNRPIIIGKPCQTRQFSTSVCLSNVSDIPATHNLEEPKKNPQEMKAPKKVKMIKKKLRPTTSHTSQKV